MNNDLKFTDAALKIFYIQLLEHYQECLKKRNTDVGAIYTEMYTAVQYALEAPHGHLKKLPQDEKQKVLAAFEFLFQSLPLPGKALNQADLKRPAFNPAQSEKIVYVYHYSNSPRYTWIHLNTMSHSCSHSHTSIPSGGMSSNTHTHSHGNNSKTDYTQILAIIALLLLASAAAALVFLALYHMFSEFMEATDRFWYGEGWLRAALMLASSLVFAATSTLLAVTFAALPIAALAVAAGLDPFVIAGIAVGCLTVMGAGLGTYVMGLLHDSIDKNCNEESMDPSDPNRFRLTKIDEERLRAKDIDPLRVKCAMIALRAEIAKVLGHEDKIPSYINRGFFGNTSEVQNLLDKVRAVRYGELNSIQVGGLTFDFTVPLYNHNRVPSQYEPIDSPQQSVTSGTAGGAVSVDTSVNSTEQPAETGLNPAGEGQSLPPSAPPAYSLFASAPPSNEPQFPAPPQYMEGLGNGTGTGFSC